MASQLPGAMLLAGFSKRPNFADFPSYGGAGPDPLCTPGGFFRGVDLVEVVAGEPFAGFDGESFMQGMHKSNVQSQRLEVKRSEVRSQRVLGRDKGRERAAGFGTPVYYSSSGGERRILGFVRRKERPRPGRDICPYWQLS